MYLVHSTMYIVQHSTTCVYCRIRARVCVCVPEAHTELAVCKCTCHFQNAVFMFDSTQTHARNTQNTRTLVLCTSYDVRCTDLPCTMYIVHRTSTRQYDAPCLYEYIVYSSTLLGRASSASYKYGGIPPRRYYVYTRTIDQLYTHTKTTRALSLAEIRVVSLSLLHLSRFFVFCAGKFKKTVTLLSA